MTEIIVIEFYHLFLTPEQFFVDQDGSKWYSQQAETLHDRNLTVICFEKASCWDSDTNQQYFISLPNGEMCKSDLRIATKFDYNVTSSELFTYIDVTFALIFLCLVCGDDHFSPTMYSDADHNALALHLQDRIYHCWRQLIKADNLGPKVNGLSKM